MYELAISLLAKNPIKLKLVAGRSVCTTWVECHFIILDNILGEGGE